MQSSRDKIPSINIPSGSINSTTFNAYFFSEAVKIINSNNLLVSSRKGFRNGLRESCIGKEGSSGEQLIAISWTEWIHDELSMLST